LKLAVSIIARLVKATQTRARFVDLGRQSRLVFGHSGALSFGSRILEQK
jgi:hypothetical protein